MNPTPRLRRMPALAGEAARLVWRASRGSFILVVALQLVTGALTAGQVLLGERVLRGLVSGVPGRTLLTAGVLLAASVGAAGFLGVVQRETLRLLGEVVARHAQGDVLDVAGSVELVAFDDPDFHDRLERARLGAELRPAQMVTGLLTASGALLGVVAVTAALVGVHPLIAAVVLLAALPLWLAAAGSTRALYRFSYQLTANDRERSYLGNLLTGKQEAKEIRAYGAGGWLRDRFDALYADRLARMRRMVLGRLRMSLAANLAYTVAIGAVVAGVVWLTARGVLSLPQAGAAVVGIGLLSQRLATGTSGVTQLYESALFLDDYASFLRSRGGAPAAPVPPATPAASPDVPDFGRIGVERVTFRYANGHQALDDVSLHLDRGEVVALVGENGSGKTTLAKLLAGLYRPTSGRIRWDRTDVAAMEPGLVRDRVAVVFQDFVRYSLTAADNVALGRPDRAGDVEAVRQAAVRAGADGFLGALPHGYQTRLGPEFLGGHELSYGQWQRVALARAYLRDAPLVILDEPTASLDPRAEAELFGNIRDLLGGRTVLLISHRFASVSGADRIYVLERGRIVEQGTHRALLAAAGRYAEMFRLQARPYQDVALDAPTVP